MTEVPKSTEYNNTELRSKKLFSNLYEISGSSENLLNFISRFNSQMEMGLSAEEIRNYIQNKIDQFNYGAVFRLEIEYDKLGNVVKVNASLNPGALSSEATYGPQLLDKINNSLR